ncbi:MULTISPECIES: hypothetical protein [Gluconobacter]|uniref:Phage tail protein n=1 Tax=Gluconobacter cadivus TaxID=2728101 RepID=A0ABR9YWP0_9PROT|nr:MULTISPECIES: hypothetical protein [Gluconobacter]MBF0888959.1 hypothetical protein [Gluconobacter cadivus]MBS1060305.1 hypothetical protein [Gluconobacter sp. Dm-44]
MAVLYDEGKDILRASDGSVLLDTGPAPGSIEDFAGRFRRLLPTGWFPPAPQGLEAESAPVLAAILRGFGAVLAGIWQLMQECSLQMRLATMSGAFLDMAAEDYFGDGGLVRQASEPDVVYRKRIRAALFAERNTRQAVTNALVAVTGVQPVIIETLNASDCHALACESVPAIGGGYGYGAQALRYGSLQGGQFFVETQLGKAADLATVCRVVDQTAAMGVTGWIKVKN